MKKLFLMFLFFIAIEGICQIAMPAIPFKPHVPNKIVNTEMTLVDRGSTVEVFSFTRAKQLRPNQFKAIKTQADSALSSESFGVAFNHTLGIHVFLTGEISFKLPSGYTLSSLAMIPSTQITMLGNSSLYVCKARTPKEVVQFFNYLQSNNAVEWVELFSLNGKFN